MELDRVTITGADDSVEPEALLALGREYPFVEWGILVSQRREGGPRFPDRGWIAEFEAQAGPGDRLSLHVCGRWVRQLLVGVNELPAGLIEGFERIQLNFHAERTPCFPDRLHRELRALGQRQFIFQIDGALGNRYLEALYEHNAGAAIVDAVPLFDVSGGAGLVPPEWPKPLYLADPDTFIYHGYAGGLGPETLERELPRIAEAAGPARIWIDMETRVRSADDERLDLGKVRRCLDICVRFVAPTP